MVEGVKQLQINNIIQPFKYCIHLEKDELKPSFDLGILDRLHLPNQENRKVWRSFCANFVDTDLWQDPAYDRHGHVGFAWGAKRAVLDKIRLYDRALIGGADHIIAHAAAGQINHSCIAKSFTDNLDEIEAWSREFHSIIQGKIGCVKGGLYHLWHGDIAKRDYLRRIQKFTPLSRNILRRDRNGLFETDDVAVVEYMEDYFDRREVTEKHPDSTEDKNICEQIVNINTREADRCFENFS
ncbi:hypothetical protein [Chamaesiphon sp.]|uniref:hypothetical protein n=1 Tax=Chamaesiphon sp. TaxID=2814140 RepID=UPI0035930D16